MIAKKTLKISTEQLLSNTLNKKLLSLQLQGIDANTARRTGCFSWQALLKLTEQRFFILIRDTV